MSEQNIFSYTGINRKYFDELQSTPLMRGTVVNSVDGDNLGRVQVRVPSLHGIPGKSPSWIEDDDLPYARPGIFNSAGNDYGQYLPPIAGTVVYLLFEDSNPEKPIYLGGIPLLVGNPKLYNNNNPKVLGGEFMVDTDDTPSEIDEVSRCRNIIYKSIKGAIIYTDDNDRSENLTIVDQSGQTISMISNSIVPLDRRGGRLYNNPYSYIKLSHSEGKSVSISDNEIRLTFQNDMEQKDIDHADPNASVIPENTNPVTSVVVSDTRVDITYEVNKEDPNRGVFINGKRLESPSSSGITVDTIRFQDPISPTSNQTTLYDTIEGYDELLVTIRYLEYRKGDPTAPSFHPYKRLTISLYPEEDRSMFSCSVPIRYKTDSTSDTSLLLLNFSAYNSYGGGGTLSYVAYNYNDLDTLVYNILELVRIEGVKYNKGGDTSGN